MLEHTYAYDLVKAGRLVNLAIVPDLNFAEIGKARLLDPRPCEFCLAAADRYAENMRAIVPGCMHDQPSPSATDVKEPFARLEPELPADVVKLLFLCRINVILRGAEVGRGIHHPFVEPEGEEFV